MTDRLPHGEKALVDVAKLEGYCLNASHPRGRHKARIFREVLDLGREDAAWLREILLAAARSAAAEQTAQDSWGVRWRLDLAVRRQGKTRGKEYLDYTSG